MSVSYITMCLLIVIISALAGKSQKKDQTNRPETIGVELEGSTKSGFRSH